MIELYYNLLAVPAEHCAGNVGFERVTVPQICGAVPVNLGQKNNEKIIIFMSSDWELPGRLPLPQAQDIFDQRP